VYAHACRALSWLRRHRTQHRAHTLVGYEVDLKTPPDGSDAFWRAYRDIHSFVPQELAREKNIALIRAEFQALCTVRFHEINETRCGLIELVAILQSRDYINFVS
jgi:hypothetical protein